MHLVFLNPQGNFDQHDSHLTEHPDFGGQLVYVKEISLALTRLGHKVDIVTRLIDDPEWPEFSQAVDSYEGYEDKLRIIRLPCGGPLFLNKENLWQHIPEFIDNLVSFYGDALPDFATAHYADGGYCAVLLKQKTGIGFTFTGHSLGAQKLDKLGMNADNVTQMEQQYRFSTRIAAERMAMTQASRIITSTSQERLEQYSHALYQGAVDVNDDSKFSVIPPGVNTQIFNNQVQPGDEVLHRSISDKLQSNDEAYVVVSSRLDEKKNIIGVVKAYAENPELQKRARLGLFVRGIEDPFADCSALSAQEQSVLRPVLDCIEQAGLTESVDFLDIRSQQDLASAYRYFANRKSVFALTAFYEPFGLAPIEAAACGLAVVATSNGGPSEIFEDGSGVTVDPFDTDAICNGLIDALDNFSHYSVLGMKRVESKYTWDKTALGYFRVIEECVGQQAEAFASVAEPDDSERLLRYLQSA
ncbi:MAG: glycosyltransferase [Gammaproteobacteria bacterium]